MPLFLTRARGGAFTVYGSLTLSQGLTLQMSQGQGVYVTGEMATDVNAGALSEYTLDDPPEEFVTFEGEQSTPGYWQGVRFSETTSEANVVSRTGIYHTGSAPHPYLAETEPKRAAVAATGAAETTVEDCHIADYEGAAFAAAFTSNDLREDSVNSTINTSGNVIE